MKIFGMLFFSVPIPVSVLAMTGVQTQWGGEEVPAWLCLGMILLCVFAVWFIWAVTDQHGNGPPMDKTVPEWRREMALRRYQAEHPEEFEDDEEMDEEPQDPNEYLESRYVVRMGMRVRLPGKQ
jgi:hypothetical protein